MGEDLKQVYDGLTARVTEVYQIFKDFFGEENVDLQGLPAFETFETLGYNEKDVRRVLELANIFILVYYPTVRVTNEYDKFVDIQEVYIKVVIDLQGRIVGKFSINRAKYSNLQFSNNYMHSHICDIPVHNFSEFQIPCTGSGPINRTICSLAHAFDADLWKLFCLELDKFIHVESIAGTPYHRLEGLTNAGRIRRRNFFTNDYAEIRLTNSKPDVWPFSGNDLVGFIKYFLHLGGIKFTYSSKAYYLAMSPVEFYTKISNCFIDWYNKKFNKAEIDTNFTYNRLLAMGTIRKAKFVDGKFAIDRNQDYSRNIHSHLGTEICEFKGQHIYLSALDEAQEEEERDLNAVHLLHQDICNYILTKILNIVNFNYGRENNTSASEEEPVFFL